MEEKEGDGSRRGKWSQRDIPGGDGNLTPLTRREGGKDPIPPEVFPSSQQSWHGSSHGIAHYVEKRASPSLSSEPVPVTEPTLASMSSLVGEQTPASVSTTPVSAPLLRNAGACTVPKRRQEPSRAKDGRNGSPLPRSGQAVPKRQPAPLAPEKGQPKRQMSPSENGRKREPQPPSRKAAEEPMRQPLATTSSRAVEVPMRRQPTAPSIRIADLPNGLMPSTLSRRTILEHGQQRPPPHLRHQQTYSGCPISPIH